MNNEITLRDWFAGMAMQAMVSACHTTEHVQYEKPQSVDVGQAGSGFSSSWVDLLERNGELEETAEAAYIAADAMIKARNINTDPITDLITDPVSLENVDMAGGYGAESQADTKSAVNSK